MYPGDRGPHPAGTWPDCPAAMETATERRPSFHSEKCRPVTVQWRRQSSRADAWTITLKPGDSDRRGHGQCLLLVMLMPPEEEESSRANLLGPHPQTSSDNGPYWASGFSQAEGPAQLVPLRSLWPGAPCPHTPSPLAINVSRKSDKWQHK